MNIKNELYQLNRIKDAIEKNSLDTFLQYTRYIH